MVKKTMWELIDMKMAEKGWSIYRLAENAGLKPSVIYALRDGKSKSLMFDTVVKIADALGVSLDEFR